MLAFLLSLWLPSQAQFGSSVQGTVTDQSGAVVSKAAVTLHNTGTGQDLKGTTDGSGYYRFVAVAPGDYTVNAAQAGFKTASVAVTVTTDENRGVDVVLVPAGGTVNVTVTTAAPVLNPDETRIETTLASDEITKLPLAGHDVQQIIALTPGVTGVENTNPGAGYGATLFAGSWAPPFQSNGQGTIGNLYLIDDLPVADDINQGGAIMMPNADMIDTVALQTQTFSVENGTSASLQTSFSTKAGGNKFHGDMDYTYAGANFGAADGVTNVINKITPATGSPYYQGAPYDVPQGDFHQNEFLGSVGGPIWKDKTFFFFSFQKQNQGSGAYTALTQDDWDPAFVSWGLSTWPTSGTALGMTKAPDSAAVPGPSYAVKTVQTVLGATACPTSGSTYIGTLPTSTLGTWNANGATQGGTTYSVPCSTPMYDHGLEFNQAQPFDGLQFSARVDQTFNNGDRVYAMFEHIHQSLGDLSVRPNLDATTPSTNRMGTINWVHIFSPKLINEFHGGIVRSVSGLTLTNPAIAGSIPYNMIGLDTTEGYAFKFLFDSGEPFAPEVQFEHTYNLRDTLSYNWHNHTIRGGYQLAREDYLIDEQVYARGGFGFNRYNAFAMMSDQANFTSYLWTISGVNGEYQAQNYGATSVFNSAWGDDVWKIRPNLTVTMGLRYDDFGNPSPYSNSGYFSPLFPGAGSTFQQQTWNTTTGISMHAFTGPQNNNWQPRIGFAYTPFKDENLTVHGGFGLYENALTPEQIANNLPTQPPTRISLTLNAPVPYGDFTTASAPFGETYDNQLPFPVYGNDPSGNVYNNPSHCPTCIYQVNLNGFNPTVKPEKYLLYSFGVEKEFMANLVAGATYSGSHGYDLVAGAVGAGPEGVGNSDWNLTPSTTGVLSTVRPSAEWGQLRYTVNAGTTSNYNALILTLKERAYKGLSWQADYNWERALQWAPSYNDSEWGNIAFWPAIYQAHTYYGPSSFDVTNSFSFGGSYVIPTIVTQNHILSQAASGWSVSTITVAQTGTAFSVGNTSGPSYAFDDSISIDGSGGGTPAFPTYKAGLPRKGFSRSAVSQTGAFTAADFTDPVGAGSGPVLSQQGANTFRNPGYFNVNLDIAKVTKLPFENATFTLRGDFINLLNRTNWGPIDNDVAEGANFGFSTTTLNKRFVQLGGRFEF
jgi:hypothetical protein